jgi:hypothetical protein
VRGSGLRWRPHLLIQRAHAHHHLLPRPHASTLRSGGACGARASASARVSCRRAAVAPDEGAGCAWRARGVHGAQRTAACGNVDVRHSGMVAPHASRTRAVAAAWSCRAPPRRLQRVLANKRRAALRRAQQGRTRAPARAHAYARPAAQPLRRHEARRLAVVTHHPSVRTSVVPIETARAQHAPRPCRCAWSAAYSATCAASLCARASAACASRRAVRRHTLKRRLRRPLGARLECVGA